MQNSLKSGSPLLIFALACLNSVALARPSPQRIHEFEIKIEETLEQYGSKCVEALNHHYTHVSHYPQTEMGKAAWQDIADLGTQPYCNALPGANYVLSNFNQTAIPGTIRFGLCLPKVCQQQDYNAAGDAITNAVFRSAQKMQRAFSIQNSLKDDLLGGSIAPEINFQQQFFYRNVQEFESAWLRSRLAGMVAILTMTIILAIICMVGSWYGSKLLRAKGRRLQVTNESVSDPRNRTIAELSTRLNTISQLNVSGAMEASQRVNQNPNPVEEKRGLGELIQQISIQRSVSKVTADREYKYEGKDCPDLALLDGLRFFACMWLLVLATASGPGEGSIMNSWKLIDLFPSVAFAIVVSGTFAMDEFFMLSAFLSTIKIIPIIRASEEQEQSENESSDRRISSSGFKGYKVIPQLWLYRYLRLAPVYYFVFLFSFFVLPFFGQGPIWFTYNANFQSCDTYWWSVFTMTINFFPQDQNLLGGCFNWGWIIACEMQIFIFLPFFIWALYKSKWAFFPILFVAFAASLCFDGWIAYYYGYTAGLVSLENTEYWATFLDKPYTKLYAVIIGVGVGFMFDARQRKGKSIFPLLAKHDAKAWIFCIILWALCFFTLYTVCTINSKCHLDPYGWTRTQNALYITFSRPIFCLSVSAMVIPLFFDFGMGMKNYLSGNLFKALGRLSYGAYLVYPIVNNLVMSEVTQSWVAGFMPIFFFSWHNMIMCFLFAFILFVFIEEPCRVAVRYWYGEKHWTGKKPMEAIPARHQVLAETGPAYAEIVKKI